MTTLTDDQIGETYADLMLEIKARLHEIEAQLTLEPTKRRKIFIAEYCYLQLRRIAELTSLAILIAHNPTEEFRAGRLIREWNPDTLLKMIGKLRPAAFPQRGINSHNPPHDRVFIATALETTDVRDKICAIYTGACDKLHVGALKSRIKGGTTYDFNDIDQSWRYLVDLLDEHIIYLPDGRIAYTKLGYPDSDGVTVNWVTLPTDDP